ncbi:hypothetical protein GCM10028794_23630 [Silanimonas algicola]
MGTAAAEGKLDGDGSRDELGFRRRGDRTTRLEAFVDAAFAFALSLMVVAVGSVPRSPEELAVALKGVPAFAACFWLIATFWRGHVDWSERFGLDDPRSRQLSLLLIFLALVFVFPLKIVFAVFFDWISGGVLPSGVTFAALVDVQRMFQTFAIAFGSMGAVLWALNRHAWRRREALGLEATEVLALQLVMRLWAMLPVFSIVSLALSLWPESLRYGAPGMIFFLMHLMQAFLRRRHRRRLASALASSTP